MATRKRKTKQAPATKADITRLIKRTDSERKAKLKHAVKSKATPDNDLLMQTAIDWWHRKFPKSELRRSVHVSAVMHGK